MAGVDNILLYGGCPVIADLDVISPTGSTTMEMSYDGSPDAAIVGQKTLNLAGFQMGVMISGFSFDRIRDVTPTGLPARTHHLHDILSWLGNVTASPTGGETLALTTALEQNYPNPFNPSTTISYSLKTSGHVTLHVYNVSGQLVRTLNNGVQQAGEFSAEWNGRDNADQRVSSGVYFYKLDTEGFTKTRKMVLLK